MRVLEDALIKSATHNVILRTRTDIALYVLNQKRSLLRLIEERFGVAVTVEADDTLTGGAYHALERGEPATGPVGDPLRRFDPRRPIEDEPIGEAESEADFELEADNEADVEAETEAGAAEGDASEDRGEGDNDNRRRRRRRRGRGRGFERDAGPIDPNAPQPSDEGLETLAEIGGDLNTPVESGEENAGSEPPREDGEGGRRGRGRWRRRGRGPRSGETSEFAGDWRPSGEADGGAPDGAASESSEPATSSEQAQGAESHQASPSEWRAEAAPSETQPASSPGVTDAKAIAEAPAPQPAAAPAPQAEEAAASEQPALAPAPRQPELPVITAADPDKPKRSGWWARAKAGLTGN
jgi:ribonuclease E